MHELQYNAADKGITLPAWVTRPTVMVQALVSSSFMLAWLTIERATSQLLIEGEFRGWSISAGLGVALLWALGLRYVWAVALSAGLGLVVAWQQSLPQAVTIALLQAATYAATAWALRRTLPPGRLPTRPIDVGAVIAALLACSLTVALLGVGLLSAQDRMLDLPIGSAIVSWAAGEALGMLIVAPLMVLVLAPWACQVLCKHEDESKARYMRAIGGNELTRGLGPWVFVFSVAITLAILACIPESCDPRVYYLGFIALPAMAMRYRLAGGMIALAVTCLAGGVAVRLYGIDLAALADLQLILIALAVSTYLVGSFAVMRMSAEERRQTEHRWATMAMRGSGLGRWNWEVGSDMLATDYVLTDAFGYRRDRVESTLAWWEQRIHPEDVELNKREMQRLIEGKSDYFEVENRMLAADGTWGWYHSQGTVIERDAQGQPRHIAGTHHDVTEQKDLERIRADAEATHRSEQRFRTLADGAPVAIFQTDAKGVYLYVNPTWQAMTGRDQNDALYRNAATFAHPDDREEVASEWNASVQTASAVAYEHRVIKPDGRTLWLQTQATPMKHNGVLLGYVGTGVDVTPYREAMTMIRDSEARYRTLADHAYDMLWRVSADAVYSYISPSVTKLLGYTPDEMLGTNAFDSFHPDDLQRVREKYAVLTPEAPEFHDVHRYRRKDGSYIVFEAVGRLVVPEEGEDADPYITGISRDVTQRVESERIRRELEEKLSRSQKLDAIGTFATGIAHDFRNSLLAIKASAQSAQRKLESDHAAMPALTTVEEACSQAMQVTQSLLTFARGQGSTKRITDLTQLVHDNARLMGAVLPAGITLELDCPDRPIKLNANAGELQQALLNLTMNAKDAIQGQGKIVVRLAIKDNTAELSVQDDGSGMPSEVVNRALEPFFTTKARLKGTGLGLSQVHGIVTDHGGEIAIVSKPDGGTTITITLPLPSASNNTPSPTPHTEAATP